MNIATQVKELAATLDLSEDKLLDWFIYKGILYFGDFRTLMPRQKFVDLRFFKLNPTDGEYRVTFRGLGLFKRMLIRDGYILPPHTPNSGVLPLPLAA
jgi:hypothetical protein